MTKKSNMNVNQRKVISDNLESLIIVTEHLDLIVGILLDKQVINNYMANNILNISDRKGKLREFYLLMTCRGPDAYKLLRECLRTTGNVKAAELLEAYKETGRAYANNDRSEVSVSNDYIPIYKDTFTCENDITIHPERKFMDVESENPPNGVFRMRSRPKGYALIINIVNIENSHLKKRSGSEIDYEKVQKLFKGLGYEVTERCDLDKTSFEQTVKSFSENPALAKVDSLVVFIMSHGFVEGNSTSIELSTADGQFINSSWIIKQFTSSYSPLVMNSSVRKPKIFFFQACRGYGIDVGRENENRTSVDSVKFSVATTARVNTTFRQYEDVMIINSTVNGYNSKRDPREGSWFVKLFCDIVVKNAWRYDLETMIGQVDEQIRLMRDSAYGFQTPEIFKQGLHKKIFFNPGLYEDENGTVIVDASSDKLKSLEDTVN